MGLNRASHRHYGPHLKVIEYEKLSRGARAIILRPDGTLFERFRNTYFGGDTDRELGHIDDPEHAGRSTEPVQ